MLKNIYKLLALGGLIYFTAYYIINYFLDPYPWSAWWVANVFHTLGGAYAFFFTRAVFQYATHNSKLEIPRWLEVSIFVAGALVLGVFWEWYELIIDRYEVFVLHLPSIMTYADNIGDLAFDALGGLISVWFYLKYKR